MVLQGFHFPADLVGFEHGNGRFLEGDVGAAIEVRAAGADGFDEFLRADHPCDAPAWEAEAFREAVDDENVWGW